MTVRERVKANVERILARWGPANIAERIITRDSVLAFHNVIPDGTASGGDDALHLPRSRFESFLDVLQEFYDVVPLAQILVEPEEGQARPRVAISFDDAYRGALILGLPALADRGLPATVFVPGGLMGASSFWWDGVAGPGGRPLEGRLHQTALEDHCGDGRLVAAWARESGLNTANLHPMAKPADLPELDWAADFPGMTLGAHGWWHRNFTALSAEHLAAELTSPLAWLVKRYAGALPVLAYPYGLTSPSVEAAAAQAGYRMAFRGGGGRIAGHARDPMSLPRISVPAGLSPEGLRLRLTGVLEG